MFTIKFYAADSLDYEAFAARSYKRRFVDGRVEIAMEDGANDELHQTTRVRTVEGTAYIENLSGKTIDVIKAAQPQPVR